MWSSAPQMPGWSIPAPQNQPSALIGLLTESASVNGDIVAIIHIVLLVLPFHSPQPTAQQLSGETSLLTFLPEQLAQGIVEEAPAGLHAQLTRSHH